MKINDKNLENKIKFQYNDFNNILEAIHDDVLITDAKGTILEVSDTFKETYRTEEEVVGQSVFELERKGVFKPSVTAEVIRKKCAVTMKQTNYDDKHIVVTAVPIRNGNEDIELIVSFSRDVTDFYNLQNEYAFLENKLERYEEEIKKLRGKNYTDKGIIAESESMKKVIEKIQKIAVVDAPVLLSGASGTGKSLFAKILHEKSDRKDGAFIDINCGAIPENLLEAELFGYTEGAFTGATKKGKMGLIELADGGTLFLDEIGELSINLQVKLLKAIQEKKIRPVGGSKEKSVDFRLITATNRNLIEMIEEKTFREDLYYRINVVSVELPNLKDRKEDIYALSLSFLEKLNKKYGFNVKFSEEGIKAMLMYDWPGNVRQLENVIEKAILLCDGNIINKKDLEDVSKNINKNIDVVYENIKRDKDERISEKIYEILKKYNKEETLKNVLEEVEKEIIIDSWEKNKSSQKVARELGLSQPTAYRKITKYREIEKEFLFKNE